MSFWTSLIGGGVTSAVEAIGGVIDDVHTSKEERAAAQIVMEKLRQEPAKLQAAINKVEAQHRSVFVAGWRPFIGWVCGFALAYIWLIRPLLGDLLHATFGYVTPPLEIGAVDVVALLGPLLGIGGLRTVEKLGGRTK
ncbi:holin family protein [bacterium]|nr:holin family protein [bacterium]